MKIDNRIKIPWYRRTIKSESYENVEINPIVSNNINIPKPKPRPRPIQDPVRSPVRSPVLNPVTNPIQSPVPNPFPNPNYVPNPVTNPIPNPVPNPVPNNPFPDNGFRFPYPVPIPERVPKDKIYEPVPKQQPVYSKEEKIWVDNFVKHLKTVSIVTGIATREIYNFISNFDFEKKGFTAFRSESQDKFGTFATVILTIAIVGKHVITLWGRRATALFTPPIILDDEFFKDKFGDKIEM